MYNGRGPHPVSDACDYARFCSALDFGLFRIMLSTLTNGIIQSNKSKAAQKY